MRCEISVQESAHLKMNIFTSSSDIPIPPFFAFISFSCCKQRKFETDERERRTVSERWRKEYLDSPAPNEIQILRDQVDEKMDVSPELFDVSGKVSIDCEQFLDGKFGDEGVGRGIKVEQAIVNVCQLEGIEGSEAEHPALEDDQLETMVSGHDERAESSPVAEASMGRFIVDRQSDLLRLVYPGK